MQANPLNAQSPLGAFRGFARMQGRDACNFSPYCIYHNQELSYSSLYGYYRKGIPADASLIQGACAYCPSLIGHSTSVRLLSVAYGLPIVAE